MKKEHLEAVYDVVINIASGWFGVAVIRDIFRTTVGRYELYSMLYNLRIGTIYLLIALKIKGVTNDTSKF
ncbi:hypothetical protein COT50_03450 [candidate division WWE3 bacterium CG08_land_8_20_14_0_20_41_10]|uniref:Uncharacterized protein n=1 Tax=candidate division WWE3 bacterium CG08_land_8_20_14_0_20_41_10 TaxID=1975085 RepID=A0A2H0XB39_UNCKA|nr:MAG: hypothetical protein COT50_03450 [candidate division WWE3 bacterium CG08_land_8_20_14_0_20_41_10]